MDITPDDYLTIANAFDPETRDVEALRAALAVVARWLGGLDDESAQEAIGAHPCPFDVAYIVLSLAPADGTVETARAIFAVQAELSRLGVISRATPAGTLEHHVLGARLFEAPTVPDYPPEAA